MQQYGIDHGQTLQSHLDDVQRARLFEAAKAAGVSQESLNILRPWLAGQTLEEALFSAAGFDNPTPTASSLRKLWRNPFRQVANFRRSTL